VAKVNACSDGKRLHKQVSFDGRSLYTNNSIIQFDSDMFDYAVQATQIAPVADELAYNNTIYLSTQGDDD
jgi:hypothetical protein